MIPGGKTPRQFLKELEAQRKKMAKELRETAHRELKAANILDPPSGKVRDELAGLSRTSERFRGTA